MRGTIIIAAIATVCGALMLVFGHVFWYSDGHVFLQFAEDLTHIRLNPDLLSRSPGYPIVPILSGATSGELYGTFVLHTLMGIAAPVMIYLAVRPFDRLAAFIVALVAALSFITFGFALMIYQSQTFMFDLALCGFLLSLALRGHARAFYWLAVALVLLAWMRPTGYVVAALCLAVILYTRVNLRYAAAATALFLTIISGFAAFQSHETRDKTYSLDTGAQLFYNPYFRGLMAGDTELIERLWTCEKFSFTATETLAQPDFQVFWPLLACFNDDELMAAALRALANHPVKAIKGTLANLAGFTIGPPWTFHGDADAFEGTPHFLPLVPNDSDPPTEAHLYVSPRWISTAVQTEGERALDEAFGSVYLVTAPAAFVLMLIGLFGIRRFGFVPLGIAAVYAGHVGPMAVLVDPQFRYQAETVPLALMGAGFGLAVLLSFVRDRRKALRSEPAQARTQESAGPL